MYSYIKVRIYLSIVIGICSVVFLLISYKNEPEKKYAILALTLPTILGGTMQGIGTIYFQIVEKIKKILFPIVFYCALVMGLQRSLLGYILFFGYQGN